MPLKLSDFAPIQQQRHAIQQFLASELSVSGSFISESREDKEAMNIKIQRDSRTYNHSFSQSSTLAAAAALAAAREWLAPKIPGLIAAMELAMAEAEQAAAAELSAKAIEILTIANQKPAA